jgi:hypothetical protein
MCHTATVIIEFIPYLEQKYAQHNMDAAGLSVLVERARTGALKAIELIRKHGLERFG